MSRPFNTGNNYHTTENPYMTEYSATLHDNEGQTGRQGIDADNMSGGSPPQRGGRLVVDTKFAS